MRARRPPVADLTLPLVWRGKSLSLGDAACLATAAALGLPVLAAERAWAALGLAVEVRLLR